MSDSLEVKVSDWDTKAYGDDVPGKKVVVENGGEVVFVLQARDSGQCSTQVNYHTQPRTVVNRIYHSKGIGVGPEH